MREEWADISGSDTSVAKAIRFFSSMRPIDVDLALGRPLLESLVDAVDDLLEESGRRLAKMRASISRLRSRDGTFLFVSKSRGNNDDDDDDGGARFSSSNTGGSFRNSLFDCMVAADD